MPKQDFRILLLRDIATRMTCQEANCPNYDHGWAVVLDVSTAAHAGMATWIKEQSRRRFYEFTGADALEGALRLDATGDLTVTFGLQRLLESVTPDMAVFLFPPGQQCFKEHKDREVVFRHNQYVHTRPLDFNEDFNETADRVNTALRRG